MRTSTLRIALILCGFTLCLVVPLLANSAHAQNAADTDLAAVWQRVQQSGVYRFSADITQTTRPGASVANAGRSSHENRLYLEGTTDVDSERLALTLWSGGGSVLDPDAAVEIRVEGAQAQARRAGGEWEAIEDFTGLFAPGGDFLAYTQAATNVVRHAPETRATALGDVVVTRYSFAIDGRHFARSLHGQLTGQAVAEGLPAAVRVEVPAGYSAMTGLGELWVGEDGLPLRQTFTLEFPADEYGDKSSAIATVDFFDFADAGTTRGRLARWRPEFHIYVRTEWGGSDGRAPALRGDAGALCACFGRGQATLAALSMAWWQAASASRWWRFPC